LSRTPRPAKARRTHERPPQLEPPRPKPTARQTRAQDTRERILEAALFEFAEFGVSGVALRDISARSQVPLSALHYHFGSKEDLFSAAIEHIFRKLQDGRLALLRKLETTTRRPSLEAVLEAFVIPTLKLAAEAEGRAYLRLQARMYDAREVVNDRLMYIVLETTAPFRRAIAEALPGLPEEELIRGYRALVRDVLGAIADPTYELLTGKPSLPTGKAARALIALLVRFHAAGLRALWEAHSDKAAKPT
jgi:AcrR family transcriptional regulator